MSDKEREKALAAWIASRPESVQKLAAEFPLGTAFDVHGELLFLVGYNEDDSLIVSRHNPAEEYELAMETKQWMCASHFRSHVPPETPEEQAAFDQQLRDIRKSYGTVGDNQ